MVTFNILLKTIEDIRKFVDITATVDCSVELTSGSYTVDGKSLMGIFGLDLRNPVVTTLFGEGSEEAKERFADFIVE